MISVAIQAGGQSSRMGRDKGIVPLAGRPLIEHVLARVEKLGSDLLITTNRPADYAYLGRRLVSDEAPGAGALPGLSTALAAARGEIVLVVACDMPFLHQDLLRYLLSRAAQADVVAPEWDGQLQPMHAVYRRASCLAAIQAALSRGQRRLISFHPDVTVEVVPPAAVARFDPTGRTFFNVNTPDDLAAAAAMLAETSS